jgi:uncharacterized membrane protein YdjX (TVP38/TMEM64 family)
MAPATGSIMAAVPLNKAGVGSAVNDTTREVGGALGIAVLGSIANSTYRNEIDADLLAALPQEAADAARESVGAAMQIAAMAPAGPGEVLATEAGEAFTTAFGTSLSAAAIVAGALGLTVFLVGRREPVEVVADDGGSDSARVTS